MSTAYYPQGMRTMPSSGYNHNSSNNCKQYIPWKGTGLNSFPVGTAPGHIRPLTNNDPGNVFQTGFGLARPIKHYRKGRVIPVDPITANNLIGKDPHNQLYNVNIDEAGLINYNMNRFVASSKGSSLGGGAGGRGLLNEMLDNPGSFIVKQNTCSKSNLVQGIDTNNPWNLKYMDQTTSYSRIMESSTGQYLVSVGQFTNTIITSNDYGNNWTSHTLPNLTGGWGIAISETGQYQYVTNLFIDTTIYVYKSSDYGSTWNEVSSFDIGYQSTTYDNISVSFDGSIVVLVTSQFEGGGCFIYKSTDYGVTFNEIQNFTGVFAPSSKMSSDGTYITLVGAGGILISSDSGTNFASPTTTISDFLYPVVMSSNGMYQVATSNTNSNIYYSSDYGNNWYTSSGIVNSILFFSLTMTGDGSTLLAVGFDYTISNSVIYYSIDNGVSWIFYGITPGVTATSDSFNTYSISISQDGNYSSYVITNDSTNQIFILNNLQSTLTCVNIDKMCKTCEGVAIVASYKPNTTFLEENPEPNTQNPVLCCNDEYKAKRRAIYASTNLKKNYYTTHKQYLQNRCKTYDQKVFNFQQPRPVELTNALLQSGVTTSQLAAAKPGSPLATSNTYIANCFPNAEIYDATEDALVNKLLTILLNMGIINEDQLRAFLESNIPNFDELFNWLNALPESDKVRALAEFEAFINNPYWGVPFAGPSNPNGCKLTVYKPNNPQYAVQGAVDSSTRMLKLNVDTITTNSASIHNRNSFVNYAKNKVPGCNTPTVFQFQNKKSCYYKSLPQYQVPVSQPSPYRYFPGVITSSNHFSQSPNTYNTTSGTGAYR
jgi:photosystem II stability/assembly factor-like uncharacterized protein